MVDTASGVPVPTQPFLDSAGYVTPAWRQFFVALWKRTGSGSGGGIVANLTTASTATGLPYYANDAAAKAGGVPQWGFYLNNSGLSVRRMP